MLRVIDTTGWHGKCFVLPDQIFGDSDRERLILQSSFPINNTYTSNGTLDEWRQYVSSLCQGNSRLILAVSSAFAAPLLYWLDGEDGGFHFRGPSCCGKTTALKVACSVWGGKDYLQRWRTTLNGLEALAALHSDTLLCLDELGQADSYQVGEAAYLLAHGTGKNRANQFGQAKKKHAWRLLFLSTGETSLAQHMLEAGKKVRAGQEVRIVEIHADTGKYGMFENTHQYEGGKAFAEALDAECKKYHGTAGRQFLTALLAMPDTAISQIKQLKADLVKKYYSPEADGQVGRVLNRFVLVATAGEVATGFGITGWQKGDAIRAAIGCFQDWLKVRGGIGPQEEEAIISQVKRYFQQHGGSCLMPWDAPPEHKTINRAGFSRKEGNGELEYYIFPEAFKTEICEGFDPIHVAKVCAKHGLLKTDPEGGYTRSERLPGIKNTARCYRFTSKVLGDET